MKHTFILLLGAMLSLQGQAQDKQIPFQNTIKVEAGDSHADIIAKAAHVVPSPNQLAALQNEFIAFIHFGPNSFTRLEWGSGKEDPKVFDLKELDTDQWCEAMKAAGNKVISILAARTKDLIILEDEVRKHSDEVIIMTDDGSYGEKGLVTNGLEKVIAREKVDLVCTIGPAVMMKFVSLLTMKYDVPTICSLNTIMVDGNGMCGACRVTVGGKMRFVCVDGPEFDAHQVDFDEMIMRLRP